MDAIKCIKERRSVREYTNKDIPKDILKEIIDCARLAPTANNLQPWDFIIVQDSILKKKISNLKNSNYYFVQDVTALIIVVCEDTKYYLEDGCAATENILLAAKAYGIGSCWVAGDKKDYANDVLKLLNVPDRYKLISIISLGYPKEEVKAHDKKELKEVLHWEKF